MKKLFEIGERKIRVANLHEVNTRKKEKEKNVHFTYHILLYRYKNTFLQKLY